jgi:organic hydroperoxide reductase OsmC/OhrA
MSNPSYVDPEEAFVASLSSCHMLTFLYIASRKGFVITEYVDEAVGTMTKNAEGTPWISVVVLRPRVTWGGEKTPTAEEEHALHEDAHHGCFIAQSVKTDVTVEPAR